MIGFLLEVLFYFILMYGIVKTVQWFSETDNRARFVNWIESSIEIGSSSSDGGDARGGSDSGDSGGGDSGGGDSGGGGGGGGD